MTTEPTTSAEELRAEIAALQGLLTAKKAELRALRASTAKDAAEPKACGCGCGEMTRGGDFLPGHDARFRGRLLKAIDGGDESAIATLLARPSLLHGATEADLRTRLGSDVRREKERTVRTARRQQTATDRAARDADRAANARLQGRSRAEMKEAAAGRLANKERARATASGQVAA